MTSNRRWSAAEPSRTVVVCVECQNGVLGSDSMLPALAADAQPALAVIESLLAHARRAGVLVVHTPFEGLLGGDPGTTPLMGSTAEASSAWKPGHPATQILPQLLDPSDLLVPRHHGVSPTWGTELLPVLRARKIDTLVFAGVSLNIAIPLAVGQAAHEGFHVVVPRDAVVGTPADYGRLVLRNTIAMLARVVSVADLIQAWSEMVDSQPMFFRSNRFRKPTPDKVKPMAIVWRLRADGMSAVRSFWADQPLWKVDRTNG